MACVSSKDSHPGAVTSGRRAGDSLPKVRGRRRILGRFDDEPALDVTELDLVAVLEPVGPVIGSPITACRSCSSDPRAWPPSVNGDAGVAARDARVVDADGAVRLAADRVDAGAEHETPMSDAKGSDHYLRRSNFLT